MSVIFLGNSCTSFDKEALLLSTQETLKCHAHMLWIHSHIFNSSVLLACLPAPTMQSGPVFHRQTLKFYYFCHSLTLFGSTRKVLLLLLLSVFQQIWQLTAWIWGCTFSLAPCHLNVSIVNSLTIFFFLFYGGWHPAYWCIIIFCSAVRIRQ